MIFQESAEKRQIKTQIRNRLISGFISNNNESVLQCGFGERGTSLLNFLIDSKPNINYTGIDAEHIPLITNLPDSFLLRKIDIQSFLEETMEKERKFDWLILTGILDKNTYGESQYQFLDTFLRRCLEVSNKGIVISFNTYETIEDNDYNIEFLIAYINAMYASYNIRRLNETEYVICIFSQFV